MSREKDKMKNRNMPAKPIFDNCGFPTKINSIDSNVSCSGLTKLEYAAIQIFSASLVVPIEKIDNRVEFAVDSANELFDELEKQEKSE